MEYRARYGDGDPRLPEPILFHLLGVSRLRERLESIPLDYPVPPCDEIRSVTASHLTCTGVGRDWSSAGKLPHVEPRHSAPTEETNDR